MWYGYILVLQVELWEPSLLIIAVIGVCRMRVSPNLKAEIFQYVGERGLNEAVLKWVYGWMNNKGFRERLHMLRRVEDFIKH